MSKFNVGDLAISNGKYEYTLTNSNAICEVVSVPDEYDMLVVVKNHVDGYKPTSTEILNLKKEKTWRVSQSYFDIYKSKKETNKNIL